jgi:uncharacterized phage protein (TIGR02218 family)
MSYGEQEISAGTPFYLYKISVGTLTYFYTNFDDFVNYSSNVYDPLAGIRHSEVNDELMDDNTEVKVYLPFDTKLAEIIMQVNLGDVLYFSIYRGHASTNDVVRIYDGYMSAYSIELPNFIIVGDRNFANVLRPSASLSISSKCNVPLYGNQCKVDKNAFKEDVVFVSKDGPRITVTGLSSTVANYYAGGYVEFNVGLGVSSKVNIETSSGGVLLLDQRIPTIAVGAQITVYPGCDHRWEGDCLNKFNNTINCPAFPFMNKRNPFGGAKVY